MECSHGTMDIPGLTQERLEEWNLPFSADVGEYFNFCKLVRRITPLLS